MVKKKIRDPVEMFAAGCVDALYHFFDCSISLFSLGPAMTINFN